MTVITTRMDASLEEAIEHLKPVLEQHRDAAERDRRLPDAVVQAMRTKGLLSLLVPKVYGGQEKGMTSLIAAAEAVSTIDSAAGWNLANMAAAGVQAALLPEEGAQAVFGSDVPTAGSAIPRGQAIPVEGGFRLSGRWPLVSGCYNAVWLGGNSLVFEDGAPRLGPGGIPDFKLMFFPASQARILDTWYSTGMRGTGSADVEVSDIFVPDHLTFSLFTAQPRMSAPVYRAGIAAAFFTGLVSVGLGIARAAIDAFVALAKDKVPTLSQTALSQRPTVHAEVARAQALLQAARASLYEVAAAIDALPDGVPMPESLEARRRLACNFAADACEQVVDSMYKQAGMNAIYSGHPLDRCLRDIHTVNQHMACGPVWWEKTGQFYFDQGLGMP